MNFITLSLILLIFLQTIYTATNTDIKTEKRILPFSRIKINNDNIYFTLSSNNNNWHKLLSIDDVGCDAIVNFSMDRYGKNKCDYEIDCWKYNIIVNFDKVYFDMKNKNIPDKIGFEYELENTKQNGIDVECTNEKFLNNSKMISENVKLSKNDEVMKKINIFSGLNDFSGFNSFNSLSSNSIFKGLNKFKKTLGNLFNGETNKTESEDSTTQNLRKEITEIKTEISKLEKQEEKIKNTLLKKIEKIDAELKTEKSIIENIWKREVVAGVIGAILVFAIIASYYICNGLLKAPKSWKDSIN